MITGKQVTIKRAGNGDFIASVGMIRGYGRTRIEALRRLAANLSWYGIGHAL